MRFRLTPKATYPQAPFSYQNRTRYAGLRFCFRTGETKIKPPIHELEGRPIKYRKELYL